MSRPVVLVIAAVVVMSVSVMQYVVAVEEFVVMWPAVLLTVVAAVLCLAEVVGRAAVASEHLAPAGRFLDLYSRLSSSGR